MAVVVSNQFAVIQQLTASFTATIYVKMKHRDREPHYKSIEYDSHFAAYMVRYEDKNGDHFSIEVKPKSLPILITYDPLNSGP